MLRILKYQPDAVSQFTQVKIIFINILTMKIDRPGCRLHQTVQVLDQGGLSGTGMSDHADKLSILDR